MVVNKISFLYKKLVWIESISLSIFAAATSKTSSASDQVKIFSTGPFYFSFHFFFFFFSDQKTSLKLKLVVKETTFALQRKRLKKIRRRWEEFLRRINWFKGVHSKRGEISPLGRPGYFRKEGSGFWLNPAEAAAATTTAATTTAATPTAAAATTWVPHG